MSDKLDAYIKGDNQINDNQINDNQINDNQINDNQLNNNRLNDNQIKDNKININEINEKELADNKINVKNKRLGFKNYYKALQMELREHKSSAIVYFSLRLIVILIMFRQIVNANYESVFLCLLTLLLLVVPSFVQITFKVELPTTLEIIVLLFIFAAEILGEINEFYILIPFWDTILHTLNGFLAAAIGFSLVDLLNRNSKLVFQMSPLFMAIVSFCFSMTIGVIWEFFEFGMDSLFNLDMQKDTIIHAISSVMLDPARGNVPTEVKNINDVVINGKSLGLGGYLDIGLIDTMEDLFVNFIGATVFSIFGFIYVKTKGKHGVAGKFIMRRKKKDRDFLKIVQQNENAIK